MNADSSINSSTNSPNEAPGSVSAQSEARTIRSDDLLLGAKELLIRHGEDTYRLRVTQTGKLILQK